MLAKIFRNHVLTNLSFVLVMVVGTLSYLQMPREQDPSINFNWIDISTFAPGLSSTDVEKRITDVIEEGVREVDDIKFVSSSSSESLSNVLVRFNELKPDEFDKRLTDLRREIQSRESQLPDAATEPFITEITTANAFPTATVVVQGLADDDVLRRHANRIKSELERIKGVDSVNAAGLRESELRVVFDPVRLQTLGLSPMQLADTVALRYRTVSAGSIDSGFESWLVRLQQARPTIAALQQLPIVGAASQVRVADAATIEQAWATPSEQVFWKGQPAVMLSLTKKAGSNTLELIQRLNEYLIQVSPQHESEGVHLFLADDQTEITRNALNIMQTNAGIGLAMVLLVVWLFLGFKVAALTAIGIPFVLAGTFWVLQSMGVSLNVMVLLGVVISLGMLVDDAVVVVESIHHRAMKGDAPLEAAVNGLREVFAPVTTAVLTTMAAFLPLMLLPGIVGQFMKLVPIVVTTALALSLVEAYWILPSHMAHADIRCSRFKGIAKLRQKMLHKIRLSYARLLIRVIKRGWIVLLISTILFFLSLFAAFAGQIKPELLQNKAMKPFLLKTDFFASDQIRLFYVNVEMEEGSPLEYTAHSVKEIVKIVEATVPEVDVRSVVAYTGSMFTETKMLTGSHFGQIMVSLLPKEKSSTNVDDLVERLRKATANMAAPKSIDFLKLAGGPPTAKAISVKIRGDNLDDIRKGAAAIKKLLQDAGWATDISDDDENGLKELVLAIDYPAAARLGVDQAQLLRLLRLLVDGEQVAELRDNGETVGVRVISARQQLSQISDFMTLPIQTLAGSSVPLSAVLKSTPQYGIGKIKHYNYKRTVSVESDIDKSQIDTLQANAYIQLNWQQLAPHYPSLSLDFTGQLDDLNESLDSIAKLMLFGVLLMYAILGTQFRSYFQPFLILSTVPMAFIGVVAGLLITQNPLSLFTLYGVVALAGIAVNAAIVLISTANTKYQSGMSLIHATVYAGRRRIVPILITSLTTVVGLFSLAAGIGGESLMWGPVGTAIVWGLAISTLLTLFLVPVLFRMGMSLSESIQRLKFKKTDDR